MKNSKKSKLGKIISKSLIDLEKNQNWLSEQIGVNREQISLYVTGKSIPSAQRLYFLSRALNVSIEILAQAIIEEGHKIT